MAKHSHSPKKDTGARNVQTSRDKDSDAPGLRTPVSRAFASGWVQNSGVASLIALIAFIVAVVTSTQIKAAAITFALVATAFSWILAASVIKWAGSENPQFAV